MSGMIKVRQVQAAMALVYAGLAMIALMRDPSLAATMTAFGLGMVAYWSSRTLPDGEIPRTMLLRACGVGVVMAAAGLIADLFGGPHALGWAVAVMGYCAGNRLKAAGVGASVS